jgi:radical SAM protein with 4Fe4S-binding SPASM domain
MFVRETRGVAVDGRYMFPKKGVWVWQYPDGYKVYTDSTKKYTFNHDAIELLRLCNGQRTVNDIVELLRSRKTLTARDVARIEVFFGNLVAAHILDYMSEPANKDMAVMTVGDDAVYKPMHACVELCDACNLKCDYCYREAGPSKQTYLVDPIEVLTDLHKQGVRVVELSGGEPLMHPAFNRILDFCTHTFAHTALLTNGVLLNEQILDLIDSGMYRCSLQVSVPSIRRERFTQITGKDQWERLHGNLGLLKNRDITFRIAMTFQDDAAVAEFREAAYLAHSLGAVQFVCTPFISLGRAKQLSIAPETVEAFVVETQKLQQELPAHFLGVVESGLFATAGSNCGAGSRRIVVDPQRKLRPCPMFPADEFSSTALENPEIRERMSHILRPEENTCGDCEHLSYCRGCILRGFLKHRETQCEWGKSQNIDEIFAALRNTEGAAVECAHTEVTAVNQ